MPTSKQEANTRSRVNQVEALLIGCFGDAPYTPIATEIVATLEEPILDLVREQERSRNRMLRLIRAQDRVIDGQRRGYTKTVMDDRIADVARCRTICDDYGDLQTINFGPEAKR